MFAALNFLPHALSDFGYLSLFIWVFAEQIGVPIPSFPVLVAAGAMISGGHFNLETCLLVTIAAAFLADLAWFQLGRKRGAHVLNLICRISWKPDTCITTTTALFTRYGDKTLLFAKFIPGLSTLAPPMAGMARISFLRFAVYDGLGCAIWGAIPIGIGMFVRDKLLSPTLLLSELKQHALAIGLTIFIGFVLWRLLWRLFYRLDLRKELRNGITPDELKALLDQGNDVVIVDVRHPVSIRNNPFALPSSRNIDYKALLTRASELPSDKPLIVYCDCPSDEGAVAAVQRLRKLGFSSARPLLGGLHGWKERRYATIACD